MANTVDKVIKIAEAEVGYLEKKSDSQLYSKTANAGYGNYTKYGKEMHTLYPSVMDYPAPYCDAFVDWCFYKAYGVSNAKGLLGGNFNDYTPSSANLYKNKKAWYTSNPKVGDQIFFKNSTRICHTGLVYKVDNKYVYTIEGNTSGASGVIANGGGVCKKKYSLTYSKIAGYGRPKYDVEASTSVIANNDYSLIFNATYYANKYSDLKAAFGTNSAALLNHFKTYGMKEGRQAIATFDVIAYKNRYIDLQKAFGDDLPSYYNHYVQFGYKEGRIAI